MSNENTATPPTAEAGRAGEILQREQDQVARQTDILFAGLLCFEWLAGIVLALVVSPLAWEGLQNHLHPHVWAAIFLEFAVISLPVAMVIQQPGRTANRHAIAVAQMLTAALLIHLTGGRIETHFHIFGSLAFLAFYRDWRVLVTATVVVALDHLLRGLFLPLSVFGTLTASPWRTVEHAAWVLFTDVFLIRACLQNVAEMRHNSAREAALETANGQLQGVTRTLDQRVRERTDELEIANGRLQQNLTELHEAQAQLLTASRNAGKADVATAVLHNVGNVLNSVNVAAGAVRETLTQSKVVGLGRALSLLDAHRSDLAMFLAGDEKGRKIPEYLKRLNDTLLEEHAAMGAELSGLQRSVDHIKVIVSMQQQYARASSGLAEVLSVDEFLDEALKLQAPTIAQGGIEIVRDYEQLPEVEVDRHKLMQIVVNLLSNARQAVADMAPPAVRRIEVVTRRLSDRFQIIVKDTGSGVAPDVRDRIFKLGFTTKQTGHGFGLHSAACLAQELSGSLSVVSDGKDKGATFTLELPLTYLRKTG